MTESRQINASIWENLYSKGKSILYYPNSTMVTLTYHFLEPSRHKRILDYGFGSGANMLYLLRRGFSVCGVEVSESAIGVVSEKVAEEGYVADLKLAGEDGVIPFDDGSFDSVIAWQVLYYNDWDTLQRAISEIERVMRPGGIFIGTMAAPGDISQKESRHIGNCLYESRVEGQEGAILLVPDESQIHACFPGRNIAVGEFGFSFGAKLQSRHWIVVYEK